MSEFKDYVRLKAKFGPKTATQNAKSKPKVQLQKGKGKRRGGGGGGGGGNTVIQKEMSPSATSVSYKATAAIRRQCMKQQDLHTERMLYALNCQTLPTSGNINDVFGSNPSQCANWSKFASIYDEYRTISMKVMYRPTVILSTTTALTPIGRVIDYDSSAALAAYTDGAQYSSYRETQGGRPWTTTALMSGVENAQFFSTSSPIALYNIKVISLVNSPTNTIIGQYLVEYMVQFRGKGI